MTTSADLKIRLVTDKGTFVSDAQGIARAAREMGDHVARAMRGAAASAKDQQAAFDRLRASVDPAFVSSQRFAEIQQRVAGFVEAGVVSQRAANIVLEQAAAKYMGVATAAQRAEAAQREAATATQMSRQGYESLRASVDPLYATSRRYEAALETLNAAQRAGIITDAERQRTQSLLETQLLGTNRAAQAAGMGANRLGSAMVNAGFQVQDFAVQVASGQSAMIAFAQQAPQLLGVLGFTGKLALIGAGLGTFIAVGMAVAAMLFDMGTKAKSADDAVNALRETQDRLNTSLGIATAPMSELTAKYGENAARVRELAMAQMQLNVALARNEVAKSLTSMKEATAQYLANSTGWNAYGKAIEAIGRDFGLSGDAAGVLRDKLIALNAATTQDMQIERFEDLVGFLTAAGIPLDKMPAAIARAGSQMIGMNLATAELETLIERAKAAADGHVTVTDKQAAAAADVVAKYEQQAALSQAIARYGKESAQVEELRRAEALRVAEAFIKQEGLTGTIAEGVRKAATAAFDASVGADQAAAALSRAETAARALAGAMAAAAGFTVSLEQQGRVLEAQIRAHASGINVAIAGMVEQQRIQAETLRDAALAQAQGDWAAVEAADAQYAATLRQIDANSAKQASLNALNAAASEAERASKRGAAASDRLAKQLDKEADKWRASLGPIEKYRSELEKLNRVRGLLTSDEYSRALEQLNQELVSGIPLVGDLAEAWGRFVASGLRNFKDFAGSILGSFQNLIAQMIATAARNQIILGLGFGGSAAGGAGAALAGGAGAAGGAGGFLAGIGAGIGGIGSAFFGGAMNSIGALFSGGFGAMFSSVGAQVGTALATGTLSSIAGSIGALLGPIGLVGLAISALIGKTKLLNKGIAVNVDGFDALVQTFQTTQKSRLFGLIKSRAKTSFADAPPDLADPLSASVARIQYGVLNMAEVLGYNASTFEDFAHRIEVSTMNMSDEEAAKAVEEAMAGMSDAFAGMIGGLDAMRLEGEGATDALTRLSAALSAVNPVMDTLGHGFRAVGLQGAGLASDLVQAFGGLDAFATSTSRYYEVFYSEAERMETATRQAGEALARLGGIMPRTREEYRRLIESLDVTTQGGRELYAALVSMSDAFDFILPKVGALSAELQAMVTGVSSGVDAMIAEATAAARANEQAAATWYRAAGSIREFIDRLRGTAGALVSARDARAYNEARYQTLLASAIGGDLSATQGLTGAAQALLDSTRATARSRVDLARAEARVLADLGLVQGVADIEGARHDVIAGLLGDQVALLEELKAYLAAGGALDPAQIDALNGQLGALGEAIKAAEMINYAFLKDRLEVTVDVLASADVPPYLKALIGSAQTGITSTIDFVTRSDLPADMKWLALTGQSELIKTVEFAVTTGKFTADLQAIALTGASTMVKTIQFLAGKLLPADLARMTLTEASTLLKEIEFVAGALPVDIRAIVLNDITALDKQINLLEGKALDPLTATLALAEAAGFSRILNVVAGKIVDSDVQALALADPTRFRRTLHVLAGKVPDAEIRALALNAAAPFQRVIDFKLGAALSVEDRVLALQTVGTMTKTVDMLVGARLDRDTLRLALAGNSELARTVTATLAADIDPEAKKLALGSLGAYSVAVQAALMPGLPRDVRRIVLAQQGSYAAMIRGGIAANMTDRARRILLGQQGRYVANIIGVVSADMDRRTRRLLLEANTEAARAITVSAVFAANLTADERAALSAQAQVVDRTIRTAIDLAGLSATGALYLAQIGLGDGAVHKSLAGTVALAALSNDQRSLLRAVSETVTKSVAFKATGRMTEDQGRLLGAVSASILRAVEFETTGRLTGDQRAILDTVGGSVRRLLAMSVTGALTSDQHVILAAGAATVARKLGLTTTGTLTSDQRRVLLATAGRVARSLSLSTTGRITTDQRRVLTAAHGTFARALALTTTGGLTSDQRNILSAEAKALERRLALLVTGTLTGDQRRLLAATGGTIRRTVAGDVTLAALSGDQTRLLRAATGTITRRIQGLVEMGSLTAQQQALLGAISGSGEGRITLGGSFSFDPTTGFRTWYETSTKATITTPLANLQSALGSLQLSLGNLRDSIVQEGQRQAAAAAAQARLSAAQSALATEAARRAAAVNALSLAVKEVQDFDAATGGNLSLRGGAAVLSVGPDGRLQYEADSVAGASAADLEKWRSTFWATGALQDKMLAAARAVSGFDTVLEAARKAVRDAGGVPAFAAGGWHQGGLRLVGEEGPELEATGPARIYSATQTRAMLSGGGDTAEVVAELRALRAEHAAMRSENTQLLMRIEGYERQQAKIARKWDATGAPVAPAEAGAEW